MKRKSDEQYSAAETARRVKAAVLGAFKIAPAPKVRKTRKAKRKSA